MERSQPQANGGICKQETSIEKTKPRPREFGRADLDPWKSFGSSFACGKIRDGSGARRTPTPLQKKVGGDQGKAIHQVFLESQRCACDVRTPVGKGEVGSTCLRCSWVGCKDEKAEKVDKAAKDEKVEKDETSSEIPALASDWWVGEQVDMDPKRPVAESPVWTSLLAARAGGGMSRMSISSTNPHVPGMSSFQL